MAVSLALRNHPSISAAQRRRVQAIAQRLGYRPNPTVAAIAARLRGTAYIESTGTIAVVGNQSGKLRSRDVPTHAAYIEGARRQASALGYRTEEFTLFADGMNERRLTQILVARGIEGMLILPTVRPEGEFELELDPAKFSMATIAYSLQRPQVHRSCVHHMRAMMEACAEVRRLGYRRPGLVMAASLDVRSRHNWRAGFLADQELYGTSDAVPLLIEETISSKSILAWIREHRPDVILHIGPSILEWLAADGLRPPANIGYVSLDVHSGRQGMSGIFQKSQHVGGAAVELIINGLRNYEFGLQPHPKTVMIDGQWRAGSTTQPQRLCR